MEAAPLNTQRLLLSPIAAKDAHFLFLLMNTPKWLQFIGDRNIKDVNAAREYIQHKLEPEYQRLGFGSYVMILKETGEAVGSCGLYDREGLEGIDLGFAILPEFEGKGYAYEACRALCQKAFSIHTLPFLKAITKKENKGSQALLQKLGFTQEGTVQLPGDGEELLLYHLKP